jgi:hypothetical protein
VIVLCVAVLVGVGVWDASTRSETIANDRKVSQVSVFTLVKSGMVFLEEHAWRSANHRRRSVAEPDRG